MLRRCVPVAAVLLGVAGAVGACSDDGGDLDAFCATAQRFAADNPATVFERYDPADPAGAATLLRDAGARLAGWAEEAPGEVDDDVATLAGAATSLADHFEALSLNGSATGQTSEHASLDVAEVEAASARVVAFTRTECAVELEI